MTRRAMTHRLAHAAANVLLARYLDMEPEP